MSHDAHCAPSPHFSQRRGLRRRGRQQHGAHERRGPGLGVPLGAAWRLGRPVPEAAVGADPPGVRAPLDLPP